MHPWGIIAIALGVPALFALVALVCILCEVDSSPGGADWWAE